MESKVAEEREAEMAAVMGVETAAVMEVAMVVEMVAAVRVVEVMVLGMESFVLRAVTQK